MTEDEAKDFVSEHLIFPDYDLLAMIEKANDGFVVWDSVPPTGISYQLHKLTMIDAIMTGLKFCGTNCIDDWAVLGGAALAVIRTLEMFVEKPERGRGKLNFVGMLGQVKVYAYPTAEQDKFWVGNANKCCMGAIVDHQHHQQQREAQWNERRRVLEQIIHQQLGG